MAARPRGRDAVRMTSARGAVAPRDWGGQGRTDQDSTGPYGSAPGAVSGCTRGTGRRVRYRQRPSARRDPGAAPGLLPGHLRQERTEVVPRGPLVDLQPEL